MDLALIFAMSLSLMLAATLIGFYLGRSRAKSNIETDSAHLVSVESAVLGLLALLLGFSFAMAVSRYETRRQYVVTEANAIGTALLRTRFLSEPYAARSEAILRRYVDLRVSAAQHTDYGHRFDYPRRTQQLQDELWAEVAAAMRQDNRSHANSLFAQSVNEVIDVYGERTDALRAHVPGGVLAVLHLLAFIALTVVGYVEGRSARRHWGVPGIVALLICLVMTLIVDLDRPREGLIETSQQSMLELKASLTPK